MQLGPLQCFLIVACFMFIGEIISNKTKAFIPSVFVTAVLFLIGFWTFVPKDVVTQASFGPQFVSICMSLLLVHLGTIMNLRKLIEQWKAVAVAVFGICGIILFTMTIGNLLFDWYTVVAATPPLTGGIVAALLMSEGLKAKGLTTLVALPTAMFITHSFFGYPLTSWCLKREGRRLIEGFRQNGADIKEIAATKEIVEQSQRKKLLPELPEKYRTTSVMLFKLMLVAILASGVSSLLHDAINVYVICLILGVIFCELGFLEENTLVKAGVFQWLITGLLAYIFAGLSSVTPDILLNMIVQIVVLIILGIMGMFITSLIIGKFLGFTKEMGFACALTALFGFPADYIITSEVCKTVSQNEEERLYLMDILLPRMLVGGFATVSIASVIITSIFLKFL